jgi:hypothetical protein
MSTIASSVLAPRRLVVERQAMTIEGHELADVR